MIRRINTFSLFHQLHRTHLLTPKINPSIFRNTVTNNSASSQPNQETWTEIYRLPLIRLASAFNRLKVYQTLITAVGTPIVFSLEQAGHIDPNFGIIFGSIGITGLLTLTLCSLPLRNLIGFVYINDEENKVKLGYVDFWGRRKDQELSIDNILAPWEMPQKRINIYLAVKSREDASQSYKLLHRYGVVRDPQRYATIFGEDNI